ncbi:c-type cytochrome [Aggregatilinea lenta]|uniref:c-type cytochrome n=1 Tax=Aggregatilinea lenta TaxID=913108 RepID=UPI000E5AC018|nr:c-type cytochrome [Aggregatilinea lenta]
MKMTFPIIVIGGLIVFFAVVTVAVFVPGLIWNPEETTIAHPYTDQQARGREQFYSNGCNYCHTQYVREEDTGMGPVSQGGNYVYDDPMILGSERTGPDLSYIGRKRSETWEIDHLKDPRQYSPMSIMPSFEFLSDSELSDIAAYLFALGDRVAGERMILPPEQYAYESDPIEYPLVTVTQSDQGWQTWTDAGLQDGKEIYVDRCLTCHGCSGNGLGSYAQSLIITPADFKQEPFRSMPDDQWFWHVSEGVQGSVMPPWKDELTTEDRWKVIRYIQQIFARPSMRDPAEGDPSGDYADLTNPVELTVATLDEGKHIFTRECMVCHGDAGTGHGPYGDFLQPSPPDFSDGSYGTLQDPSYTDADYFWRISEGLPWSAMPVWKLRYSEEDRWKLVHYIRVIFTHTEERPDPPPQGQDFAFPEVYQAQALPDTVSFERGRVTFLQNCAHCHGLAGDGQGWDGQYLDPQPADFRQMAGMPMSQDAQAEHLAKVTFGIQDTAMPSWGEWLPEDARWEAIDYLMSAFMTGMPVTESVYGSGEIAANFVTLSEDNWTGEGHVIDTDRGAQVYATYCATCHGDGGQGDGPGTQGSASQGPAPYPADLPEAYIFWRVWDGVPSAIMPPFQWALPETDIWDVTVYLQNMVASPGSSTPTASQTPAATPVPDATATPTGGAQ